ncbi:MAG: DUF4330 family protein [Clostridia bacterium]|nr:DUF4330 family protein [Clostridia bacterium]
MKKTAKLKGKYSFNAIDVLLLIVIVLSIAAIVFLFFYDGGKEDVEVSDNTFEIVYTVKQEQIPGILRGKVNMGNSMFTLDGQKPLGKVIDFSYTNSEVKYFNPTDKVMASAVVEDKIDLIVKINATATKVAENIFEVNGQLISVGQTLEVGFPYYTGTVVCTAVSVMGGVN